LALPQFASGSASRPFIAALEGPNGAGKSTLCAALSRALSAPAHLGTDPAWFGEAFKTRMIRDADWFASAMFFLSGCFEQTRLLRQQADPLVILDRSLWSTLAVHAAHSPKRLEALLALLAPIAAEVRVPSLTILLKASLTTCQSRFAQKTGAARTLDELTANTTFHDREQEFYEWLGRQSPTVVFLDADRPTPDGMLQKALALIRDRVPC
jgi:thymidylate kinase